MADSKLQVDFEFLEDVVRRLIRMIVSANVETAALSAVLRAHGIVPPEDVEAARRRLLQDVAP